MNTPLTSEDFRAKLLIADLKAEDKLLKQS